jgi:hypothetical protein
MITIEATYLNQRTSQSEKLVKTSGDLFAMWSQLKELLARRDSYITSGAQVHVSLHVTGWVHPFVTIQVPPPIETVAGEEHVG